MSTNEKKYEISNDFVAVVEEVAPKLPSRPGAPVSLSPLYNHMEKADFLYFEFEALNGISLIMFRDSSVKISAKIRKKLRCVFE